MNKPSKGIIVYLIIMVMGWILNATYLWSKILESILKIGIKDDKQFAMYIEEIFIRIHPPFAGYFGAIVGEIIALVIIVNICRLKSWARKLLFAFSSLGIIIYAINLQKLLLFYKNIFIEKLWLGYYLFALLILLEMSFLISILIFFSMRNIKAQFTT